MKTCVLMLLLIFTGGAARAQLRDSTAFDPRTFGQYEEEKKDKAMGFLGWLLFPGAGLMYAGKTSEGVAYIVVDATMLVLMSGSSDEKGVDNSSRALLIAGLVASRGIELFRTFDAVDEHNRELRARLGLALGPVPGGLGFRLQVKL